MEPTKIEHDEDEDSLSKTGSARPRPIVDLDAFGSGRPADELASDRGLAPAAFEEKHGRWFFVVHVDDIARVDREGGRSLVKVGVTMGRDGMYVFSLRPRLDPGPVATLGRGSDNDVLLPHASVSRQHCTVSVTDHGLVVRDAASSFGTFVNGIRLASEGTAQDGASLRIGQIAGMVVHAETLRELLDG